MARHAQTDEGRTFHYIESATKDQLDRLIDRAQLVKRVVYPDAAQPKPAAKRTRGPNKPKANGADASAGAGAQP